MFYLIAICQIYSFLNSKIEESEPLSRGETTWNIHLKITNAELEDTKIFFQMQ